MKIIAWGENCGVVKLDSGIISLIYSEVKYSEVKGNCKNLFNEEDVLNIKDPCLNLEYINKEIKTEEEFNEFIKLKHKDGIDTDEIVNIFSKYMNSEGVTFILRGIRKVLSKKEHKEWGIRWFGDCKRYKEWAIGWFNDCKKCMRITTEEQVSICTEIEKLIEEGKM